MWKLDSIAIDGLKGFDRLCIERFGGITSFIGQNGSGKSSVLKKILKIFEIIDLKIPSDNHEIIDDWNSFKSANLIFSRNDPLKLSQLHEYFGDSVIKLDISINYNNGIFKINRISCDNIDIDIDGSISTMSNRNKISEGIGRLKNDISKNHEVLKQPANTEKKTSIKNSISELELSMKKQMDLLATSSIVKIKKCSDSTESVIDYQKIQEFLSELDLPSAIYIEDNKRPDGAIDTLIDDLLELGAAKEITRKEFDAARIKLRHVLQSDVDVYKDGTGKHLTINGTSYKNASAGTATVLAFYGFTRLSSENTILLWDEPENGLHPTRRNRMLELMLEDNRQFILATHASEFCPVFEERGKTYRCEATFTPGNESLNLKIEKVTDRRDAFITLEAIGVHPAKSLFTANVAIWVEGPTELIFYKYFLGQLFKDKKIKEGFHYSFMQYGGGLISYLEAAHDEEIKLAFDILSFCRHPIILVDSDLKSEPENTKDPKTFLKNGASKLYEQVEKLNKERSNSAKFFWTKGREVENYLPDSAIVRAMKEVWPSHSKFTDKIDKQNFSFGQYESYDQVLSEKLIECGVYDLKKDEKIAKGRSMWGEGNKVKMMQLALSSPIEISDLQWECLSDLEEMASFIVDKSEKNFS